MWTRADMPDLPRCDGPVVVTRPEREATAWVQALAESGFEPVSLPLMAFGPPADVQAWARCRQNVGACAAVMFVSPQAVHAFAAGFHEEKWPQALDGEAYPAITSDSIKTSEALPMATASWRCWAPGPGTAQALMAHGVCASRIDQPPADAEQFDSEALWPVVRHQLRPGMRVLVVRGGQASAPDTGSGREWLARQCEALGVQVDFGVAYRRGPPVWTAAQRAQALAAVANGAVWLLSSSESVGHLGMLMPGTDWHRTCALATHPRIADAAVVLGFGRVLMSRPALRDVLTVLQRARMPAVDTCFQGMQGLCAP